MRVWTPEVRLDSSDPNSTWNYAPGRALESLFHDPSDDAVLHWAFSPFRQLHQWRNPLDALRWLSDAATRLNPGERWVGYLSYDLGRHFESIHSVHPPSATDWPLFHFSRFSGTSSTPSIHSTLLPEPFALNVPSRTSIQSNLKRDRYLSTVHRAVEYIAAGDIFQVNLSQRFTLPTPGWPSQIYHRLTTQHPPLYGAYLSFDSPLNALLCNSPELFLRVTPDPATGKRKIITRPIKGTRPRAPGMDDQLRASIKDQAELNMIIDLERNDLGRVCEIGSVQVTQPRVIEAHPTVYHGVATVEGILRDDVTFVDLLRATFPGGSITGAPKIRAMEIIEELEPVRRGPYCGAIGYLAADGSLEFNIAIRTMIVHGNEVHIPVGGGIVADSVPEDEYEETLVKARAMFQALGFTLDSP